MDVGLSVGFLENKEKQYDPAFYLNRISNNNSLWKVTQNTGGSNYLTRRKTVAVGEKVKKENFTLILHIPLNLNKLTKVH